MAGCAGTGPTTVRADGYTATFASTVSRSQNVQHVGGRPVAVTTWVAARGKETDAVVTADERSAAPAATRLTDAVLGSVRDLGGSLLSRRRLRWQGFPAEDAIITTTDELVRERIVLAGPRLYVLEGISKAAKPAFPGYERLLRTFRLAPMRPRSGG
ncbi:MAG TPA: hypothetical protein VKV25_04335 [Acidimicrobiales bacterium]|nr:hypothetical protein [Acidimicrobiales bacterium]